MTGADKVRGKSDAGFREDWAGRAVLWAQKSCFSNFSLQSARMPD